MRENLWGSKCVISDYYMYYATVYRERWSMATPSCPLKTLTQKTLAHPYNSLGSIGNLGEHVQVEYDGHLCVQRVQRSVVIRLVVGVVGLAQTAFQVLEAAVQICYNQSA